MASGVNELRQGVTVMDKIVEAEMVDLRDR